MRTNLLELVISAMVVLMILAWLVPV